MYFFSVYQAFSKNMKNMDAINQVYEIIKTNEYHLDICTQEMKVIIRLSIQTSKKKTEVYERTLNSINNIEGLEEAFEGLQEFVEHIRNPDHVEVNLANKSILIVERSKLKNKKKIQIASLSLNLARTIEKDEEQDLIDKILLRCEDKRDLTGNEIKDFLQKIAFCISELNKERHKNEERNQIFKGQIDSIGEFQSVLKAQFEQRFMKWENNFTNQIKSIQCHESRLNNLGIKYGQIQQITKDLIIKNKQIQQMLSEKIDKEIKTTIQKISEIQQVIESSMRDLKNSLTIIQNLNARKILPQITKFLNREDQINQYIQSFEDQRKISIVLGQKIKTLPQQIAEMAGLQIIQFKYIKDEEKQQKQIQEDFEKINKEQLQNFVIKELPQSIQKLKTLKQLCFENVIFDFSIPLLRKISHIKILNIQNKYLKQLPNLKQLNQLQELTIQNSALTLFPMNILSLTKLKSLNLSNNLLAKIPKQIIQLQELESLCIQNNPLSLKSISQLVENLKNLKKLKELNLNKLNLKEVSMGIFDIVSLQSVQLSNNQFISLPSQIGNLRNLTVLSVDQCNKMLSLPTEIGKLSKLNYLSLSSEVLNALPSEIGNLVELQYLFIKQRGQLLSIPIQIQKLKNLKQLIINNQKLTHLPNSICGLTQLTSLDFDDNELTELPQNIGNLINLTLFSFSRNKLISIPQSISLLSKSAFIGLMNNQFDEITRQFLLKLKLQGFFNLYYSTKS